MDRRSGVFQTSVGTKLLIGATGLALFVYLIIHVSGNTLVLFGPEAFNGFHELMTSNPLLLAIEIALLLVFLAHIYKTLAMFSSNRRARPAPYAMKRRAGPPSRKTLASSTMIVTGLWLVAFLVLHVRSFRFPTPHYETPDGHLDLYRVEMETLDDPLVVAFYIVSMLMIGSHLWHGASSALQSLGFDHPRWTPRILVAGRVASVAIAGMFIVITLWVYLVGGRQ